MHNVILIYNLRINRNLIDMVQILLIVVGLFILLKGSLKISDTKQLTRPRATYLGLLVLAYGVSQYFFISDTFLYGLVFYASLILLSLIIASGAENVPSVSSTTSSSANKRNWLIFIGFIIVVALVWYIWGNQTL